MAVTLEGSSSSSQEHCEDLRLCDMKLFASVASALETSSLVFCRAQRTSEYQRLPVPSAVQGFRFMTVLSSWIHSLNFRKQEVLWDLDKYALITCEPSSLNETAVTI